MAVRVDRLNRLEAWYRGDGVDLSPPKKGAKNELAQKNPTRGAVPADAFDSRRLRDLVIVGICRQGQPDR